MTAEPPGGIETVPSTELERAHALVMKICDQIGAAVGAAFRGERGMSALAVYEEMVMPIITYGRDEREAAATEMRERSALAVKSVSDRWKDASREPNWTVISACVGLIRALPLQPPPPLPPETEARIAKLMEQARRIARPHDLESIETILRKGFCGECVNDTPVADLELVRTPPHPITGDWLVDVLCPPCRAERAGHQEPHP